MELAFPSFYVIFRLFLAFLSLQTVILGSIIPRQMQMEGLLPFAYPSVVMSRYKANRNSDGMTIIRSKQHGDRTEITSLRYSEKKMQHNYPYRKWGHKPSQHQKLDKYTSEEWSDERRRRKLIHKHHGSSTRDSKILPDGFGKLHMAPFDEDEKLPRTGEGFRTEELKTSKSIPITIKELASFENVALLPVELEGTRLSSAEFPEAKIYKSTTESRTTSRERITPEARRAKEFFQPTLKPLLGLSDSDEDESMESFPKQQGIYQSVKENIFDEIQEISQTLKGDGSKPKEMKDQKSIPLVSTSNDSVHTDIYNASKLSKDIDIENSIDKINIKESPISGRHFIEFEESQQNSGIIDTVANAEAEVKTNEPAFKISKFLTTEKIKTNAEINVTERTQMEKITSIDSEKVAKLNVDVLEPVLSETSFSKGALNVTQAVSVPAKKEDLGQNEASESIEYTDKLNVSEIDKTEISTMSKDKISRVISLGINNTESGDNKTLNKVSAQEKSEEAKRTEINIMKAEAEDILNGFHTKENFITPQSEVVKLDNINETIIKVENIARVENPFTDSREFEKEMNRLQFASGEESLIGDKKIALPMDVQEVPKIFDFDESNDNFLKSLKSIDRADKKNLAVQFAEEDERHVQRLPSVFDESPEISFEIENKTENSVEMVDNLLRMEPARQQPTSGQYWEKLMKADAYPVISSDEKDSLENIKLGNIPNLEVESDAHADEPPVKEGSQFLILNSFSLVNKSDDLLSEGFKPNVTSSDTEGPEERADDESVNLSLEFVKEPAKSNEISKEILFNKTEIKPDIKVQFAELEITESPKINITSLQGHEIFSTIWHKLEDDEALPYAQNISTVKVSLSERYKFLGENTSMKHVATESVLDQNITQLNTVQDDESIRHITTNRSLPIDVKLYESTQELINIVTKVPKKIDSLSFEISNASQEADLKRITSLTEKSDEKIVRTHSTSVFPNETKFHGITESNIKEEDEPAINVLAQSLSGYNKTDVQTELFTFQEQVKSVEIDSSKVTRSSTEKDMKEVITVENVHNMGLKTTMKIDINQNKTLANKPEFRQEIDFSKIINATSSSIFVNDEPINVSEKLEVKSDLTESKLNGSIDYARNVTYSPVKDFINMISSIDFVEDEAVKYVTSAKVLPGIGQNLSIQLESSQIPRQDKWNVSAMAVNVSKMNIYEEDEVFPFRTKTIAESNIGINASIISDSNNIRGAFTMKPEASGGVGSTEFSLINVTRSSAYEEDEAINKEAGKKDISTAIIYFPKNISEKFDATVLTNISNMEFSGKESNNISSNVYLDDEINLAVTVPDQSRVRVNTRLQMEASKPRGVRISTDVEKIYSSGTELPNVTKLNLFEDEGIKYSEKMQENLNVNITSNEIKETSQVYMKSVSQDRFSTISPRIDTQEKISRRDIDILTSKPSLVEPNITEILKDKAIEKAQFSEPNETKLVLNKTQFVDSHITVNATSERGEDVYNLTFNTEIPSEDEAANIIPESKSSIKVDSEIKMNTSKNWENIPTQEVFTDILHDEILVALRNKSLDTVHTKTSSFSIDITRKPEFIPNKTDKSLYSETVDYTFKVNQTGRQTEEITFKPELATEVKAAAEAETYTTSIQNLSSTTDSGEQGNFVFIKVARKDMGESIASIKDKVVKAPSFNVNDEFVLDKALQMNASTSKTDTIFSDISKQLPKNGSRLYNDTKNESFVEKTSTVSISILSSDQMLQSNTSIQAMNNESKSLNQTTDEIAFDEEKTRLNESFSSVDIFRNVEYVKNQSVLGNGTEPFNISKIDTILKVDNQTTDEFVFDEEIMSNKTVPELETYVAVNETRINIPVKDDQVQFNTSTQEAKISGSYNKTDDISLNKTKILDKSVTETNITSEPINQTKLFSPLAEGLGNLDVITESNKLELHQFPKEVAMDEEIFSNKSISENYTKEEITSKQGKDNLNDSFSDRGTSDFLNQTIDELAMDEEKFLNKSIPEKADSEFINDTHVETASGEPLLYFNEIRPILDTGSGLQSQTIDEFALDEERPVNKAAEVKDILGFVNETHIETETGSGDEMIDFNKTLPILDIGSAIQNQTLVEVDLNTSIPEKDSRSRFVNDTHIEPDSGSGFINETFIETGSGDYISASNKTLPMPDIGSAVQKQTLDEVSVNTSIPEKDSRSRFVNDTQMEPQSGFINETLIETGSGDYIPASNKTLPMSDIGSAVLNQTIDEVSVNISIPEKDRSRIVNDTQIEPGPSIDIPTSSMTRPRPEIGSAVQNQTLDEFAFDEGAVNTSAQEKYNGSRFVNGTQIKSNSGINETYIKTRIGDKMDSNKTFLIPDIESVFQNQLDEFGLDNGVLNAAEGEDSKSILVNHTQIESGSGFINETHIEIGSGFINETHIETSSGYINETLIETGSGDRILKLNETFPVPDIGSAVQSQTSGEFGLDDEILLPPSIQQNDTGSGYINETRIETGSGDGISKLNETFPVPDIGSGVQSQTSGEFGLDDEILLLPSIQQNDTGSGYINETQVGSIEPLLDFNETLPIIDVGSGIQNQTIDEFELDEAVFNTPIYDQGSGFINDTQIEVGSGEVLKINASVPIFDTITNLQNQTSVPFALDDELIPFNQSITNIIIGSASPNVTAIEDEIGETTGELNASVPETDAGSGFVKTTGQNAFDEELLQLNITLPSPVHVINVNKTENVTESPSYAEPESPIYINDSILSINFASPENISTPLVESSGTQNVSVTTIQKLPRFPEQLGGRSTEMNLEESSELAERSRTGSIAGSITRLGSDSWEDPFFFSTANLATLDPEEEISFYIAALPICPYVYHCGIGKICSIVPCPKGMYCCKSRIGICCIPQETPGGEKEPLKGLDAVVHHIMNKNSNIRKGLIHRHNIIKYPENVKRNAPVPIQKRAKPLAIFN